VLRTYSFNLEFHDDGQGRPLFASFPFIMDGVPAAGISCGISSRFAGGMASNVRGAGPALLSALGLEAPQVYSLEQIHSREVLAVDRRNPPAVPADGMVTADREIVLSATVADCLPVYLFDTGTGAFGLLHSGWKGTGIVSGALRLMTGRWHTRPEAVAAVLGPCIGSCCYQVDAERAAAFEQEFGPCPPGLPAADAALLKPVTRRKGGGWYLDLQAANTRLLAAAGVRNIALCGDCTFTDDRLGSFRREGPNYTRMTALCGYWLQGE
jgi:YfiH family protein